VQFGVAVPLTVSNAVQNPLFCIHPGTGDVWSYRTLASQLAPDFQLWGLQVPGYAAITDNPRETICAPLLLEEYRSLEHLAIHYCEVITKLQPAGDCRLLGWSSGGLLALEVARQLQERGRIIGFVGMVDSQVPDASRYDYTLDGLSYLDDGLPETLQAHPLYQILKPHGADGTADYIKSLGIGESSSAQLNHIIRIMKYLRRLEGAHRPVMPAGPVHLFLAEDPSATEGGGSLLAGWRSLGGRDLCVDTVPGNHFTVFSQDNTVTLAHRLSSLLNQANVQFDTKRAR
jgi:thioesterase domain-containing protein